MCNWQRLISQAVEEIVVRVRVMDREGATGVRGTDEKASGGRSRMRPTKALVFQTRAQVDSTLGFCSQGSEYSLRDRVTLSLLCFSSRALIGCGSILV